MLEHTLPAAPSAVTALFALTSVSTEEIAFCRCAWHTRSPHAASQDCPFAPHLKPVRRTQSDEPAGVVMSDKGQLAQAVMPAATSDAPYVSLGHVEAEPVHAVASDVCPGVAPYLPTGHN